MERGRAGGDVERDEGQEDGEGRTHARICTRTSARARHTHTHTHARTHTHTHTHATEVAQMSVSRSHTLITSGSAPRAAPATTPCRSRRGHGAVTVTARSRRGHGAVTVVARHGVVTMW